jgi:hypothetical protein
MRTWRWDRESGDRIVLDEHGRPTGYILRRDPSGWRWIDALHPEPPGLKRLVHPTWRAALRSLEDYLQETEQMAKNNKTSATSKWKCLCGCGSAVPPGGSFVRGHNLAFKKASAAVQAEVANAMEARRKGKALAVPPVQRIASEASPAEVAASAVDMPVPKPKARPAGSQAATAPSAVKPRRASQLSDEERVQVVASTDSYRAIGLQFNITKDVVAALKRAAAGG